MYDTIQGFAIAFRFVTSDLAYIVLFLTSLYVKQLFLFQLSYGIIIKERIVVGTKK
jgi:hypothetical protein